MYRVLAVCALAFSLLWTTGCGGGSAGASDNPAHGVTGTGGTSANTTTLRLELDTAVTGSARVGGRSASLGAADATSIRTFRIRVVNAKTAVDLIAPLLIKRALSATQVVEIDGVPLGTVAVLIEAMDDAGDVIGHGAIDVTVTADGGTPVHITLTSGPLPPNPLPTPPPTPGPLAITSVSPSTGPQSGRTPIVITGSGFLNITGVTIGGVAATGVTVQGSTTITCNTPASTTAGAKDVTVASSSGGTVTDSGAFTYNPLPVISTVVPSSGPIGGGTPIIITGANFGASPTVTIGGTAATTVTATGGTTITCVTPAASNAGAADVTVTSPDNGATTLTGGFTYNVLVSIASVTPSAGPLAGGTAITIAGSHFGTSPTVTVGGNAASSLTVTGGTTITCTTPGSATVGAKDVKVTAGVNGSVTLTGGFTYNPAPTITGLSSPGGNPSDGPLAGGRTLEIDGTNFNGGLSVTVGGAACSILSSASTFILCRTPASSTTGAKDVVVTSSTNGSVTAVGGFTYQPLPTITSVSPASGPLAGGTDVTVSGTNFGSSGAIFLGGVLQASGGITGNTFSFFTPVTSTAGPVDVMLVSDDDGTVTRVGGFTYNPLPTITSISPANGPVSGGTSVTIVGTSFDSSTAVKFGANAATGVSVTGSTTLTCTAPAGAATGTVTVTVTAPSSGVVASANAFTYNPTSTITSVSPASGPIAGGTVITITGTRFGSNPSVTVGGATATAVSLAGSTTITCTTPAGSVGAADVVVTSASNGSATDTGAFNYNAASTITSVSPNDGPLAGGTAVTIGGTNFGASPTVSFGGNAATSVNLTGNTTITCTSPSAGATGAVAITVVSASNGSVTDASAFTYNTTATIASVTPANGPLGGGTPVVIVGANFGSSASVLFGANAASGALVTGGTTITCTSPSASASGPVTVTVISPDDGTATSASAFSYNATPTIAQVLPAAGGPVTGGTAVTIIGAGFGASANVTIGASPATGVSVTGGTTITCTSPAAAAAGPADVVVDSPGNGQVTSLGAFSYNATCTIAAVSPPSGPLAGGTPVTISGANFGSSASVTINGNAASSVNVSSNTTITCLSPSSGTTGTFDVTVLTAADGNATLPLSFTYNASDTIISVLPAAGGPLSGGTSVTIVGTNFGPTASVTIGSNAATGVSVSGGTTITCTSPSAASAGNADVVVDSPTNGVATSTGAFVYNPALTVTGIAPSGGPLAGGTPITITGSNFDSSVTVTIGGTAAGSVSTGSTTVTCVSPAAGVAGPATVVVNSPTHGADGTQTFTYNPTPTINPPLAPHSGPLAGSTSVTITGTNLLNVSGVSFGANAATSVNAIGGVMISCVTPASTTGQGAVTVTVTSTTNGVVTLPLGFSYSPPVSLTPGTPVGVGPTALAIGDVNRDGIPDAVVNDASQIYVLLGQSNGDVSLSSTLPAAVSFVALGDFDGDGKLDLATANGAAATVSFQAGDGTGGFGAAVTSNVSITAQAMRVADVNRDGKPDLVVFSLTDVAVMLGDGAGNFGPTATPTFTAAGLITDTAIGDVNRDGKPDLLVADALNQRVVLYTGNGDGTFAAPLTITSGVTPSTLKLVDLNGDGALDLVIGTPTGVTALLGVGNGTFNAPITFATTSGTIIEATDVDGDGVPDIVGGDFNTGTVSVFVGVGDGTFLPGVSTSLGATGVRTLGAVDMNRDGKPDILVGTGAEVVSVLDSTTWNGTGSLLALSPIALPAAAQSLAAADVDRNGTLDLVLTLPVLDRVQVLSGSGGAFALARNVTTAGAGAFDVKVTDFDRDGRPDLVVSDSSSATLSLLVDNGSGGYAAPVTVTQGTSVTAVAVADFNRDGVPDAVVADSNPLQDKVYEFTGNVSGTLDPGATITSGAVPNALAVGDFNRDGIPDVAFCDTGGSQVAVYFGTAGGGFVVDNFFPVDTGPIAIVAGDFNQDGSVDLATANTAGTVSLLLNDGTGAFTGPTNTPAAVTPGGLAVIDLNRDGKLDLAVTDAASNTVVVLFGDGTGNFTGPSTFGVGNVPGALTVGDFNGDGIPDIAVSNTADQTLSILLGN